MLISWIYNRNFCKICESYSLDSHSVWISRVFVMELPRFSPDTALSFGEIDQFVYNDERYYGRLAIGKCQTWSNLIIFRIN